MALTIRPIIQDKLIISLMTLKYRTYVCFLISQRYLHLLKTLFILYFHYVLSVKYEMGLDARSCSCFMNHAATNQ